MGAMATLLRGGSAVGARRLGGRASSMGTGATLRDVSGSWGGGTVGEARITGGDSTLGMMGAGGLATLVRMLVSSISAL